MLDGESMGKKTVELRAVADYAGHEVVQTGIYVFEDTTIAQIRELMKDGIEIYGKRYHVKYVEIDTNVEE